MLWVGGEQPQPHHATVYLDFEGGMVTPGVDAAEAEGSCVEGEGFIYPGFPGTATQADAIGEMAQELLSEYGVRVVWDSPPPAHLPYARVMMGGRPEDLGLDPSRGGVACVIDCDDTWARDMAFVFAGQGNPGNAELLARTAVHEVAHTWGLEHVEGQGNLMSDFSTNEGQTFARTCVSLSAGNECAEVHERFCPPGEQNSHAELLALFGPNEPDTTPPTVEILSPEDGLHVPPGTELEVEVEVSDDFGGFGWKFAVPELSWEHVATNGETSLVLAFPEGAFTIVVEAIDHDRNVAQDSVSVRVDRDEDGTGTDTATDTGDDAALGEPVASCACGAGVRDSGLSWPLLLMLFAPVRRPSSRRRFP